MIKEIEQTGMKYLCKRVQKEDPLDHIKYKGSGTMWCNILRSHPEYTIKTTVLGLYNKEDLRNYGEFYSELFNVIESKEWANLIPENGGGGCTHSKTHPFLEEKSGRVVYRKECPKGCVPYVKEYKPFKRYHNPETKQILNLTIDDDVPDGYVLGGLRGVYRYGPRKDETVVYHNGNHKMYVPKHKEPPPGYVRGVHYEGTTKGRIGCYNPITGEKRYVLSNEDIPEDFVKGLPPTTGKIVLTPVGTYNTVEQARKSLSMTRYQIFKKLREDPDNWKILNSETWRNGVSIAESIRMNS